MVSSFYGYAEISKLNPQTRYLPENVNMGMFENGHIWRGDLENEFSQELVPYICTYFVKTGFKSIMLTFSCHFHVKIVPID